MTSFRRRLAFVGILTSAIALIVVLIIQGRALNSDSRFETRERLRAEALILSEAVATTWGKTGPGAWIDELVDRCGRLTDTRLTVIALDGTVLGDTTVSGQDLRNLENHARRPEVIEALAAGEGTNERFSNTAHEPQMYFAVPIRYQGQVQGVARASLSLKRIETRVRELRTSLGLALLLVLALSSGIAWLLSSPMAAFGLQEQLAATARERARFSAVLFAMEDGLLAVDHRGVVLLANDALSRSHTLSGSTGTHYRGVFRQAEIGSLIDQVLTSGERRTAEIDLLESDRSFVLVGIPFPASPGEPHGAVITFNDVSERRGVDRIRRDFVANASHELRTPLTSIRGFVEALEDGGLEERDTAKRFLSRIRANADRMASLVDDLLELSRLESGAQPPSLEPLDCGAVVTDVVASFAKIAARKSIALDSVQAATPHVLSDGDRLRRILEHLVDNALKYTPDGGRVTVQLAPLWDGACVVVEDTGPGISPEHVPRLFERFYRVDTARSRELGGTGLGLSIVKHLAESMGASVSVVSVLGKGSRFETRLPAHP